MARVGIVVSFLILEEKLLLFTVEYDVNYVLVISGFYYIEGYIFSFKGKNPFYLKFFLKQELSINIGSLCCTPETNICQLHFNKEKGT